MKNKTFFLIFKHCVCQEKKRKIFNFTAHNRDPLFSSVKSLTENPVNNSDFMTHPSSITKDVASSARAHQYYMHSGFKAEKGSTFHVPFLWKCK